MQRRSERTPAPRAVRGVAVLLVGVAALGAAAVALASTAQASDNSGAAPANRGWSTSLNRGWEVAPDSDTAADTAAGGR